MPFTAALALMILCDRSGLLSHAFLAALTHELSHLAAMLLCRAKPTAVHFKVGAVEIATPHRPISAGSQVFISLAGPMVNLILGAILLMLFAATGQRTFGNGGIVQLCTGGFNLLPVLGLDGGTVIEALTGDRRYVLATSVLTVVGVGLWMLLLRPAASMGAGMLLSLLYICAIQLITARNHENVKRKT